MDLKEQYDKLLRYCYLKTKDRNIAEDIVQETFLRFWNSKTYNDTGKELAYLYTIARNLCNDEFRRADILDIDDYSDCIADDTANPDLNDLRIDIRKAIDKLPDDLQEILILRYVNEIPSSEIGKIFNISRFSVHRKAKAGLVLLKKYLEKGDD